MANRSRIPTSALCTVATVSPSRSISILSRTPKSGALGLLEDSVAPGVLEDEGLAESAAPCRPPCRRARPRCSRSSSCRRSSATPRASGTVCRRGPCRDVVEQTHGRTLDADRVLRILRTGDRVMPAFDQQVARRPAPPASPPSPPRRSASRRRPPRRPPSRSTRPATPICPRVGRSRSWRRLPAARRRRVHADRPRPWRGDGRATSGTFDAAGNALAGIENVAPPSGTSNPSKGEALELSIQDFGAGTPDTPVAERADHEHLDGHPRPSRATRSCGVGARL